jgi:VWFA-related protein
MQTRLAVLATALMATTAHGQSQAPAVKASTAGVLIDVSVLDSKGQPVLDLTPGDFALSEEGKAQQLISVTLVTAGVVRRIDTSGAKPPEAAPMPAPSVPSPTPPALDSTPTVTAIVFDKLSPDAMPYAARAALTCIGSIGQAHDYAGVFLVDVNLRTFQPFTSDQARLRGAVEKIAGTATANFRPEQGRSGNVAAQKMNPNTPPTASADDAGRFSTDVERQRFLASLHPADRKMVEIEQRMEEGFRHMLAEYEGQTSIAGLRAVVDALAVVPGRKSILYFTESLPVTDRLKSKFDAIIGRANRANITFYPVDAAGLRLHSKEAELGRNVNLAGSQGIGDLPRENGAWTKDLERQNELLESRPTAVLGRLAKETGGFLIENTNNLATGVARMQQERTTYYLLGYQPAKPFMDGRFRRVTVKVNRRNVTVRARPGYLAVPLERQ